MSNPSKLQWLVCVGVSLLISMPLGAWQQLPPTPQQGTPPPTPTADAPVSGLQALSSEQFRASYVLAPGDQISIRAFAVEEVNDKQFRVDGDGFVNIPLIGRLHVGGLSVEQVEKNVTSSLQAYVQNPQVIVTVTQFRSEPVFFVGAFRSPGVYPLQGRRTLLAMLSAVGGLQTNASRRIKITRRLEFGVIPLAKAVTREGKVSEVEIRIGPYESIGPAEDITLQPFDVISVEKAEMVYVTGEVTKVGGFEVGERETISIAQLVTIAGGLGREAAPEHAKILRPVLNTSRRVTIPINLKQVMSGEQNDYPLQANDVLYIPRNNRRVITGRVVAYTIPAVIASILVVIRSR